MKVSEIAIKNVITIDAKENLRKALDLMETHKINQLPVLENGKMIGMVFLKSIIESNLEPENTKVKELTLTVGKANSNMKIEEGFVNYFMEIGLRALPVMENEKLVGIISETDLIKLIQTDLKAKDVMVKELVVINEDDFVGKARTLFKLNNIARLPVVDYEYKLKGIIDYFDLIKISKFARERIPGMKFTAMEKFPLERNKVKDFMHDAATASPETPVSEIIKILQKNEEVIITENGKPVGIITPKDLLELLIQKTQKTIIQVSHCSNIAEKYEIESLAQKFLEKLWQRFKEIPFFVIYVDKHEHNGKEKYSMRARLLTSDGLFIAKSFAWGLPEALDKLLTRLEKIIVKYEEKRRKKERKSWRELVK